MGKTKINLHLGVLSLIVISAAFSRLIPHPQDFALIGAIALSGSANFKQKHSYGHWVYCGVLFGSFEFAHYKFPLLKLKSIAYGENMSSL